MDYLLTELKKRALDVAYLDSTECRMGLVDYTSDSESDESIVQSVPQSNKSRLKVTPQESGNRPIKRSVRHSLQREHVLTKTNPDGESSLQYRLATQSIPKMIHRCIKVEHDPDRSYRAS